jgi:hypothetical protein
MVLLTSPLRQVGKNTNSIFEAVFCCFNYIFPREPATESLAGFLLPYPGAWHTMKFFELPPEAGGK